MQSLGDSTLAAFMKSDVSKQLENQSSKNPNAAAKPNGATRSNISDIDKYFSDSVLFASKQSKKANDDISPNNHSNNSLASKNPENDKNFSVPRISPVTINLTNGDSESKNFAQTTTNSSVEIPSRISTQEHCKLSSWGLPPSILRKYESRGVATMFPWQVECLSNRELLEKNRNLVYSAPTSAGKTLVAEILVIKTILERRKKVIFILPFVSVVREKMYYFQDLLTDSGFRVEGFMGGCAPAGGFAATDVAIATIEKANSLLNQLMEEKSIVNLGAVVIDELHLIGDPYRGYLLELLLTKLKYMSLKNDLVRVQLIGMSATLPNLGILADWLDAELYKTDFRPVPLNELCKIGTKIYDNKMINIRTLKSLPNQNDSDDILQLCLETITDGHSVLIFCPTKNWCEKLAQQVAMAFRSLGSENTEIGGILREQLSMEAIIETLEQLKRSPSGLDTVLRRTVSFGVAFHHAGLTMDERDVIEGSFRSGALRVLTATSTLSSGVNLPARRVIIRSLMFHGRPLDSLTYKQMIGRAGRMGKDTAGESIIICKQNETKAATTLLSSDLQPISSCLEGSEPLIRALLEAVASEVAYTARDIDLYTKCTLISFSNADSIEESTKEAIKYLVDNELLMMQTTKNGEERWIATPLGKACLAASMPPTDGLFLFDELQKARRCFVLDTELHVIYLVTPLNSTNQIGQIDWIVFLDIWKSISESERRVGQLIGVQESFLMTAIRGAAKPGKILNVHKRFYTALALHELVREVSLADVCRKYGCCRGVIQGLQQSASTFAGMITQFCKKLGWSCMELLIGQFQTRLQFGVCRDLLDLLRLPMLNGLRARSLHKEGITSVAELAVANELDVERALHKALPFESGKEYDGEHEMDAAKRNKMRSVFVTGRDGLTPHEAAIILVREARTLVQNELGVDDLQWKQRQQSITEDRSRSSRDLNNGSVSNQSSSIGPPGNVTNQSSAIGSPGSVTNQSSAIGSPGNVSNQSSSIGPPGNVTNQSSSIGPPGNVTNQSSAIGPPGNVRNQNETREKSDFSRENEEKSDGIENRVNEENSRREEVPIVTDPISSQNSGNASKICETSYNNDIFEFSGSVVTMEPEVQIGSTSRPEIGRKIRDEKRTSRKIEEKLNGVENRVNGKKIRREEEPIITDPISLQNSGNASKICETSYNNDIFEFSGTVVNIEAEIPRESKIQREIGEEIPIGRNNSQKIEEKWNGVENRINEENSHREEIPIVTEYQISQQNSKNASKICETSYSDDIFEFTPSMNTEPQPAVVSQSEEIGMKSKKLQKIPESEEKKIGSSAKALAMSPIVLLRRSDALESNSRSPSLFGDSLNIDSQECNMLEQNVIDSLNISVFGDTIISEFATSRKQNTSENRISNGTKPTRRSSTGSQRRLSLMNIGSRRSPRVSETRDRSKSLIWDDSWDNTNGVIERVDQKEATIASNSRTKDPPNLKKSDVPKSAKDTDIFTDKTTIADKLRSASSLKNDYKTLPISKDRIAELRKIAQKRKLSETSIVDKSPIASVLTYADTRRPSIDSNKSDSDDIVFPSQSIDHCGSSTKNRTKIKLESLRRSRTQRDAITRTLKMDEPEEPKDASRESCAIESVKSDSDDSEVPVKRTNTLSRKRTVRKVSKVPESRKKPIASVKSSADRTKNKRTLINEPQVVNVTISREKFNGFKEEIGGQKDISLALSCEIFLKDTISIGTKIIGITGADGKKKTKKIENCVYGNKKLCGIAISWNGTVVHYISFDNSQESKVPVKERLEFLMELLTNENLTVRCFSFKETYKILYNCCRIASSCKFLDPKTADWLMDPEHSERSFNALITEYLNEAQLILQRTGAHLGGAGPGLNVKSAVDSKIRATTESALTWHLTTALMQRLKERNPKLLQTFKEIEMGTLTLLARMELTGFGVNLKSLQELSDVIQREMSQLEKSAYSLAGKQFNFSSSKSVAQILGLYKGKKVSTNKAALENCENPISDLVVSWRKLSTTQIKMVFPLLRLAQCNSRVYGNCLTNTATGRVSMHEPNLQNVPRDFKSHDDSFLISVRMAFVPLTGNVIVSADYCQLELRILAHFSKELKLCKILRKEGDVFRNIAARWYNVTEDKIDDGMRQRTKQLCYGMIYGMGVKTLAETLSVSEDEAKEFLETFMGTYPGIRQWLNRVVDETRKDGYVTTLMERRRFFPALHSPVPSERSQAERQAINTKVQGSAADIAKKAMVTIDERMRREFPGEPLILTDVPFKRKLRSRSREPLPRGGYLVLQIHDELLYEVNSADLQRVGRIIQESMEESCQLRVPLPVKLKVGPSWGHLTEFNL